MRKTFSTCLQNAPPAEPLYWRVSVRRAAKETGIGGTGDDPRLVQARLRLPIFGTRQSVIAQPSSSTTWCATSAASLPGSRHRGPLEHHAASFSTTANSGGGRASSSTSKDDEDKRKTSEDQNNASDGNTGSGTFRGRFSSDPDNPNHEQSGGSTSSSSSAAANKKYSGEVPDSLKHFPSFWHHRQIKQLEQEITVEKNNHSPSPTSSDQNVPHYPEENLPDAYKPPQARTPGQTLFPAEKEDIEILSASNRLYAHPRWCENATILRIVRLSDPVTSPVYRTNRNLNPGAHGTAKYDRFGYGLFFACWAFSLGFWQLERMEYKKYLVELRAKRLAMPLVRLEKSPFPWRDGIEGWEYRVVQTRGVFEHKKEMWVGPRAQGDPAGNSCGQGYLVITPLVLEDGSTILVNRGFLTTQVLRNKDHEVPGFVQVRGVLEEGEIPNQETNLLYLKNEPGQKKFTWLIAEDLAYHSSAVNYEECCKGLITAYDCYYEDRKKHELRFDMRRKEDFLLFNFDEHTNFQYAIQWFSIGVVVLGTYICRLRSDLLWRF
ncbi:unnamed protein product [Amoebophrya sp. A120]|nr:unnamed protein product [Amoebophrya sp. A120]|eukprot:GSA120T00019384001.1